MWRKILPLRQILLSKIRILQIIPKNTSTLDFTYPYYKYLYEKDRSVDITLLIWGLGLKAVLKDSHYLERLEIIGVKVVSLRDYLPGWKKKITGPPVNNSNRFSRKELNFKNYKAAIESLRSIALWAVKKYQNLLTERFLNLNEMLGSLNPTVVFYDQRKGDNLPLENKFFEYLANHQVPILVVPHAPHMRTPEDDFMPITGASSTNEIYYAYCNNYATPWLKSNLSESYFIRTGYPSLRPIKTKKTIAKSTVCKVLYIGRRSVSDSIKSCKDIDAYTLSNSTVQDHIEMIDEAFTKTHGVYKLFIKPHPNTNMRELQLLIKKAGVTEFEFIHTLLPEEYMNFDFCISEPSTLALMIGNANVATAIFEGPLQNELETKWEILLDLYSGFAKVQDHVDIVNMVESDREAPFDHSSTLRRHYRSDVFLCLDKLIFDLRKSTVK
jgi:hypothetical protein